MKIIDVDKLFDKYISDYVYKNIGKVKPEEIENKIADLYIEFGKEKIAELDNKSPEEYYKSFSAKELLEGLKEHLEKQVVVSDFLCEALESKKQEISVIEEELSKENSEEYTLYLMNILSILGSKNCAKRYMEFITWDYSEPIKELATEILGESMSNSVKEDIVSTYKEVDTATKERFCEILSHCKWDDRIYEILIEEFKERKDNIPLFAGYLGRYGDDRAIPELTSAIESEKINYSDFEELRFAIEKLGGEYNKTRDFTHDKSYKKIMSSGENEQEESEKLN